jgi:hypothetical protein
MNNPRAEIQFPFRPIAKLAGLLIICFDILLEPSLTKISINPVSHEKPVFDWPCPVVLHSRFRSIGENYFGY